MSHENHENFMFYETFKEDIESYREVYGDDAAEKLAMDIIYYGVTGKRKLKENDVSDIHNLLMINIQTHIDKSKEHLERVIKINEFEVEKWMKSRKRKKKSETFWI